MQIKKATEVELHQRSSRTSKYQEIYDEISKLGVRQALDGIKPPKDVPVEKFIQNLRQTLGRCGPDPKEGYKWTVRQTADGCATIGLKKIEAE